MEKAKTSNSSKLQIFLALWGVAMVVVLILAQAKISNVKIFDLRFNAYALLSLTAALANLSFGTYVLRKRNDFISDEITWYLLYVYSLVFFGLFEMLQRLSATPQAALFWAALSGIGPAFLGVGLLFFALQFTRPHLRLNHLIPIVLLSAAILYIFFANGDTLFINTLKATKLYPWGYNNDPGQAFALDPLWGLGLPVTAIVIMLRFRKRSKNPTLRRQAKLFAIAFTIPIISALIFDSILPGAGIKVLPLAGLSTVIAAGLMLYGLTHYRFFKVTPASMSSYVLSTMTESVVVTDNKLQIHIFNEAAQDLFKKYDLNNENRSLMDFFSEDEAKKMLEEIGKLKAVGHKLDMGNFMFDRETYLRITAIKITEQHGVDGYIFAISDVTELQNSYQALEKEKASVDRKVEERTRELRIAQQRLQEADKIKTEFVILTSHNLRTPLTKILGNLEFISDTKLTKDQKTFVDQVQISSKKLSSLVEELLTITEIQANAKASLAPVKLSDIIEVLNDDAEELAKNSGNKFELKDQAKDAKLNANSARLITALHNLLDNAFKFTKNGSVTLEVSKTDKQLVLKVTDTGIGISAEEQEKLFTQFHRGTDYMHFDYEGEGIGLYLTKLIINEHKGDIKVASQEGQGTEVTVTLPTA